jgi:hypothetical protein
METGKADREGCSPEKTVVGRGLICSLRSAFVPNYRAHYASINQLTKLANGHTM